MVAVDGERLIRGAHLLDGTALVDVRIERGRIAAIGTSLPSNAGAQTIEADGRWLIPGLWDHHVHPTDWASMRHRVDLSPLTGPAEVLAAVRAALTVEPEEVVGAGLWCAAWSERPTATDLDRVAGLRPVVLVSGDAHSAVFSSTAQARYGVTQVADAEGWVSEGPWFEVMPTLGSADDATRDRWVIEAGRAAAARGIVGIVDLDPSDTHASWRRRVAAGFDAHRVRAGVWLDHLDAAIAAGLRTGDPVPDAGPLVTMGPFKVIADGSLNTRTAWCRHPFPGGDHGVMNIEPGVLTQAMTRARAAGIDATIHAIGDAALAVVLDAFAASGACGSIEHAQLAHSEDIARMGHLGLTASVQPWHLVADRDVADALWAGRTDRAYAFADMLRAGVPLALGSDAPVAPLDPWLAIAAAVTRTGDDRPAWHPEQRIGLDAALRASWGGVTDVEPGGPADLVLLDLDPRAIDPGDLGHVGVDLTLCDGNVTHINL